ncbi:GNAT family N-acetyltransferase [Endozoicomonas montiporae]|uniref:Acetyltransferase n=1 Tax=Endozoicomonas montiporae CL-33 TaxID=570277 RepID=A0A142BAA5_9GAMM|nr:GNAT family N-acetyltransferase [Endozoicomonas montiporae]AMO55681.1 acetyltransferase [Endozoicomonas montiporae CL-33]
MQRNVKIDILDQTEARIMYQWIAEAGWNPGLHDAETFYKAFPTGLIGVKKDNELVGVSSVFKHSPRYACFGNYLVKPEYRGQGFGLLMTRRRLNIAGYRNISLDAAPENQAIYRSVGFRTAYFNQRFEINWQHAPDKLHPNVINLKNVRLLELLEYEKNLFPCKRKALLKAWVTQPGSSAFCFRDHCHIKGFGVLRPCMTGYRIGPLFADTPVIAEHLMQALLQHSLGQPVFCDIPETNPHARHLVHSFGGQPIDFLCARMYRGYEPDLDYPRLYALTSLESG